MKLQTNIPLLIDFDGVIRLGKKTAEDANEFFKFIKDKNIPSCILSNSTLRNGKDIKQFLADNKIETNIPALSCADASIDYIKEHYKRVAVFASLSIKVMCKDLLNYRNPEAVIVGDLSNKWSYEILNEIFRFVYSGADFIAMQMNKFWSPDDENLYLDAGSFITAVEFATGKKAKLIGKPSSIFFYSGLKTLGVKEDSKFLMLGDDLETDIFGAQNLGGKGILIYTGKTEYPLDKNSNIKPDYEVMNLREVIGLY